MTAGLHQRFGDERVWDTPIAEAGVLGAATGAAMTGLRPVAEVMYMDFLTVCLDPIVNQAAKLRYMTGGGVGVPVVFRMQTGGGRSAGSQHSQSLEAVLSHIPGLKVFCPADARDAYDLLVAAIRDPGPVCYVENRRLYRRRDPDWDRDPLPRGARIVRAGSSVTVIAWGRMIGETLTALDSVDGSAADAEVIDLRTMVPCELDIVVDSVRRTGRCLMVHEAVERFGPGGELVSRLVDEALWDLDGPIRRLARCRARSRTARHSRVWRCRLPSASRRRSPRSPRAEAVAASPSTAPGQRSARARAARSRHSETATLMPAGRRRRRASRR